MENLETHLKDQFPLPTGNDMKQDSNPAAEKISGLNVFYGLANEKEMFVKRFKLRLRSGAIYSLPYALLPIISLEDNNKLKILFHDLTITISGRNIAPIEKLLSDERITYIKEANSPKDSDSYDCHIASIHIEGDIIL